MDQIQLAFDGYVYGFDLAMDVFYKKYRTLESIAALAKGEIEQFDTSRIVDVPSPVLFEFVAFLKTDEGRKLTTKWLTAFEVTRWNVKMIAIRYILREEELTAKDLIVTYDAIDIAINSLTRSVVLGEKRSRILP